MEHIGLHVELHSIAGSWLVITAAVLSVIGIAIAIRIVAPIKPILAERHSDITTSSDPVLIEEA